MDEIRNSEVKQQTTERIIYNELTKRQNKLKEIVSQYEQIQKIQTKQGSSDFLSKFFTSKAIKNGSATDLVKQASSLAANVTNEKELSKSFQSLLKTNGYSSQIKKVFKKLGGETKPIIKQFLQEINNDINKIGDMGDVSSKILADPKRLQTMIPLMSKYREEIAKLNSAYQNVDNKQQSAANSAGKLQKALLTIKNVSSKVKAGLQNGISSVLSNTVLHYFSGYAIYNTVRNQISQITSSIKELDAAFSEIALVTNKSMSDMWGQYSQYNSIARELGQSTSDVIKASALYYQQGLEEADVMKMTADTMKLATLAGENYEEAVQQITSAIHGFNLENTDSEAIMDTYVNLANKAAISVQDIGSAMNRTASIANTAGMSLEDTAAFISMIGSTTQESAETVGTAVRTMIARFTSLKKDVSEIDFSEVGEDFDVNKVQTAIQSAGIAVRDASGQTRDWSDVILELSKKWDTLDKNTKQYIATQAAGTTQQSRFLALVSDYDELVRLMDVANNSAGAAEQQFSKYSDTVQYKLNKIKETWQKITQKFLNSDMFKSILDNIIKILDKINEADLNKKLNIPGLITGLLTVGKIISSITGKQNAFSGVYNNANSLMYKGPTSALFNFDSGQYSALSNAFAQMNAQYKINEQTLISYGDKAQQITEGTIGDYNRLIIQQKKLGSQISTLTPQYAEMTKAQLRTNASSQLLTSALMNGITVFTEYKSGLITGKQALAQFALTFGITVVKTVAQTFLQVAANEALVASYSSVGAAATASIGPVLAVVAAITAVVAVIAGLLYLSEYLEQKELEATDAWKAAEDLKNAKKALEDAEEDKTRTADAAKESKEELKNAEDLKEEWEQLSKLGSLTEEQQQRKNELAKEINETMPEIVTYYNEETNELMVQNSLWDEQIDKLKEANEINKQMAHTATIATYEAQKKLAETSTTDSLVDLGYDYDTAKVMSKVTGEIDLSNPAFTNEGLKSAQDLLTNIDKLIDEYGEKYDSLSSENQDIWENQNDYINESLLGDFK